MADAGAWRHHAEVLERLLAPAQELITLDVAFVFKINVHRERALVLAK